MSKETKITKRESNVGRKKAIHNRKQFTLEIYSARLPFEDARIINNYAKANNLDRSEVVRLGLHQFALRQQMSFRAKDPLHEIQEQVLFEQIGPLKIRLDEMTAALNDITSVLLELQKSSEQSALSSAEGDNDKVQESDSFTLSNAQFIEQKKTTRKNFGCDNPRAPTKYQLHSRAYLK